ncbi:MAG: hypothetical protein LBN37_00355 [Bacteroidales bacterium]|nr:hypothetical protein [Bacteroidales bacterium]
MKKIFLLSVVVVIAITAFTSDNWYYHKSGDYRPLFISRVELDNSVRYISEKRDVKNTGKIYYRKPYLYMNERYKGVHVINLGNPANPVKEGFILAPGCIDMAVKGNILYIDNAVDLVSFDLDTKQVTKRIQNVFPEPAAPGNSYSYYNGNRPEGYILVEWRKN